MPIFEYKCNTCQKEFEILTVSSKQDEVVCPDCGSKKVQKLLSASTVKSGGSVGLGNAPSAVCGGSKSGFS